MLEAALEMNFRRVFLAGSNSREMVSQIAGG
jgi:hypothetical protein